MAAAQLSGWPWASRTAVTCHVSSSTLAASNRKPPGPAPPPPLPLLLALPLVAVAVALCATLGDGLTSSARLLVGACSGSNAASESHTAAAPRPAATTRSRVSTQHGIAPSRRLLECASSGASSMIDSRSDLPSAARALIPSGAEWARGGGQQVWSCAQGDITPPHQ
eukprot:scaffold49769_cov54-Phaeocystis_antarctica.AAC.2